MIDDDFLYFVVPGFFKGRYFWLFPGLSAPAIFQEPKVKVDQKDTEGMSALMYAAEMGHMQVPWIPLGKKTADFADRRVYPLVN